MRCVELLQHHPKCVSNIQAVLVDEFQDTNHIQYELMNLFASANRRITVVGDPDQSIYGFRAAEIRNLARMQHLYRDTSIVLLEDNYRSSGSILNSAQDVIEQDVSRPAKKLQATHSVGTMPVLRRLPTSYDEAEWIVLEIQRCVSMTGNLLKYSDFAILLRSASLSRLIETEMGRHGVPYKMVGGLRFFDRVEIKLLLDYMRVVSSPGNNEALLRIINVPPRRIGDESIKMLANGAQAANMSLWEFIKAVAQGRKSPEKALTKLTDQGLCTFVGIIESSRQKLQDCADKMAPNKLLEYIIKKISFRDYLTSLHGQNEENRWANVEELLNQASDGANASEEDREEESLPPIEGVEQEQAHPGEDALSHFLANVALSTEIKPQDAEVQEGEPQPDEKVTISTIHAAKGLEWPVVFVPSVHHGVIPHSRSDDQDEERRLLYVAMTRAQALLYLSAALRASKDNSELPELPLSGFIPPAIVNTRFRRTGPNFMDQVVYGIADILHRPRPSQEAMLNRGTTVPSPYDNRWMADGSDNPDAVKKKWDGSAVGMQEPDPKRRRYDQNSNNKPAKTTFMSATAYTMNNPANFSAPPTTMSSGFSTAREYIATAAAAAEQQPDESNTKPKPKPSGPSGTATRKASGGGTGTGTGTSSNSSLAQGSISSYFGQPASAGSRPKASLPQTSQAHHGRQQPQSNPVFQGVMPPRRLPQAQTLQRPRPVLEPSDPNNYTWLATPPRPTGKPIMRNPRAPQGKKQEGEGEGGGGGAKREINEVKSKPDPIGNARPVNTFHATTMSMVQQQQSGPARKTLGIRRTMMNGWQERMSRAPNGNSGS